MSLPPQPPPHSKARDRGKIVEKVRFKKGQWTIEEDEILAAFVNKHGEGNWNAVHKQTGLARCGKSCRLRWTNHLRPDLKKGSFTLQEQRKIITLHAKIGNKWAQMAQEKQGTQYAINDREILRCTWLLHIIYCVTRKGNRIKLPGRTDNEIKNFWNTRKKKYDRVGLPLYPPDITPQILDSNPESPSCSNQHTDDAPSEDIFDIPQLDFRKYKLNQEEASFIPSIPSIPESRNSEQGSDSFSFPILQPQELLNDSDIAYNSLGNPSKSNTPPALIDQHDTFQGDGFSNSGNPFYGEMDYELPPLPSVEDVQYEFWWDPGPSPPRPSFPNGNPFYGEMLSELPPFPSIEEAQHGYWWDPHAYPCPSCSSGTCSIYGAMMVSELPPFPGTEENQQGSCWDTPAASLSQCPQLEQTRSKPFSPHRKGFFESLFYPPLASTDESSDTQTQIQLPPLEETQSKPFSPRRNGFLEAIFYPALPSTGESSDTQIQLPPLGETRPEPVSPRSSGLLQAILFPPKNLEGSNTSSMHHSKT